MSRTRLLHGDLADPKGAIGFVSIAAWGLATPIIAFAIINLFHAVQYFALVWLKARE